VVFCRRYPPERGARGNHAKKVRNLAALVMAVGIAVPAPLTGDAAEDIVLTFPQNASTTRFIDTYGAGKADGRVHRGEDLHAPKGAPVYAASDGVVVRMGDGPRAGYYLVIQHADQWQSWYMHLNNDRPGTDSGRGGAQTAYAQGLDVGDFVKGGQLIGFVGDSGNAEGTEPHTHFELHKGKRPVNPYHHLFTAYQSALGAELRAKIAEVGAT